MSGWHPDPPIYAAVTQDGEDRVTLVRALLAQGEDPNAPDDRGYPPLTCDGVLDDLALMEVLLEGGADPNGMSGSHRLLRDIVRGFYLRKTKEAQARLLAGVERLLQAGADPNLYVHAVYDCPLWIAIKWGWVELVPILLAAGADPHLTDDRGQDALEWAIQCESLQMVEALAGAEAAAAAADRIPDPDCERTFQTIMRRLETTKFKLRFTWPGYKYQNDVFYEYYWQDGQWMEVEFDEYFHKRPAGAKLTALGPDAATFRDRLVKTQQLDLTINAPRRQAWRAMLETGLVPRSVRDLLVQVRAAQLDD